jgi:glycosyltransferase involved in cell wall biosynthesis
MNWNGVQVFGNSYHPWAMDVIAGHSKTFGADALVSVMDLQVFDPDALMGTKWIAWMPLDHHNIPPLLVQRAKQADFVISMSKHGQEQLLKNGVSADYAPCGVDLEVMKPMDRVQCRKDNGFPLDKFLIGMVAMNKGNPSRKAFNQTIAAFAALKAKHGDVALYLHTGDGMRGHDVVNLLEVLNAFNLKWGYSFAGDTESLDVIFANQYGLAMGYEPAMMAKIFNSFDVCTGVTRGEGFGIPLLEAQACGTPVISGDWTAMSEIFFSGWQVSKEEAEPLFTPMGAWQYDPHAGAIAEKMEMAYQMRGNEQYRKRAADGAKPYNADNIIDKYWIPVLNKIGEQLKDKTPASVKRNLEVLR